MTTEVVVAIIGAIGLIGAAGFGFLGVRLQSMKRAIGEPNGHGNVAEMLVQLLAGQSTQDGRLAELESRVGGVERRVADVERRVA